MEENNIAGMRRAVQLGRTLQHDLGEKLKRFYEDGGSLTQAVEEFDIQGVYSVDNLYTAKGAVQFALAGANGIFGKYEGLITDPEKRRKLATEHLEANAMRIGKLTYEQGRGIHSLTKEQIKLNGKKGGFRGGEKCRTLRIGICGLTPEQRREASKVGGQRGGRATYEKGIGIHGMAADQKTETSRVGGSIGGRLVYKQKKGVHSLSREERTENANKGNKARGLTLWSEEEKRMAYELGNDEYFQRGSIISNLKIAQALNGLYHDGMEIRDSSSVESTRRRYSKSLESRAQTA